MEAIDDPGQSSISWVAKLVEVLQPLSLRADRLAGMSLFAGLRWSDLEFAADRLRETEVERGTRMTVQGHPSSRLWLITQGEALVSADARPLRVVAYGDPIGIASLLHGGHALETTIALTPIRALAAGADQFRELAERPSIRERLLAFAPASSHVVEPGGRVRRQRQPSVGEPGQRFARKH